MLAILIALVAYLLLGIAFILDKYILTNTLQRPVVYAAYSTVAMAGAFALLPFTNGFLDTQDLLIAVVSGLLFSFGLWTFFLSAFHAPITRMAPLNAVAVAIFSVLFSFVILQERFTYSVSYGIVLLIISSIILSFSVEDRARVRLSRAIMWGIVSGACFALSHVLAKLLYMSNDFWTVLVWSKAPAALLGAMLLCFSFVRKGSQKKKKDHAHPWGLIAVNKVSAALGEVLIQVAVSMSSVALVFALSGAQFIFVFIGVFVFSLFFPRLIHESFSRRGVGILIVSFILLFMGLYFVTSQI